VNAAAGTLAAGIAPPSAEFAQLARARQETLIKPRGALGRLEDLACWFAACQHRAVPRRIAPAITVFAADHGVAKHGVSAYPAAVTRQMLRSLGEGVAAINVLARSIDAEFTAVDVGVAFDGAPPAGVHDERIAPGTQDLSVEPAMTVAQVQRALDIGARYARVAIACGCDLLIAGEIGIGNTTAAACLISAALGADPASIVGNGTGVNAAQRAHKLGIVRRALDRHGSCREPVDLLASLGGFEIAATTGFYLESARAGVPCVLDGFISAAAALVGCAIDPALREWLLASHLSGERGHGAALARLALVPLVDCGMRLGEGTGAALVVPLLQSALRLHAEMATFAEAGVSDAV